MRLTVVGCSGSAPGPGAPCSCYLVEHAGFRLLLDLGSGALTALPAIADPLALDAVFLSHLHGDHWLDLVPLAVLRRLHPRGPAPVLPVYAPPGAAERIAAASGMSLTAMTQAFDVRDGGTTSIGPFAVRTLRTRHPVPTNAVRLTVDGVSLAYTADTAPFDTLVEWARGTDLLLAEATFTEPGPGAPANPEGIHLTGADAGVLAQRAGVGRLLLTHLAPWTDANAVLDEATAAYAGPLELAAPGAVVEL